MIDIITEQPFCQTRVMCRVFICEYYNHTGRIKGECEIKARNMEEATTHFKFFYPKKMNSSTMAFAWFVWEIGYEGEPIIRWL